MNTSVRRSRDSGQVIVLFAAGLVTFILAAGLILDAGFALSQVRYVQNSADAAARSGALALARRAAQGDSTTTCTLAGTDEVSDEDVRNAVFAAAAQNDVQVAGATYTDFDGAELGVEVGSLGSSCPPPVNAVGVRVAALRTPATFLIRVVGLDTWTINQAATAISGPTSGCVDTEEGCTLLPVTFPVNVFACTNNGRSQLIDPPQTWSVGEELVLPLCGNNPGSVGWLDWDPPDGGASELEEVILDPPPIDIPLPSWQYVTETGDISSSQVEDALNNYSGQIVLVPMFDDTCLEEPPDKEDSYCPTDDPGQGQNQWYWITKFLAFKLASPQGAFINGNFEEVCGLNAKECLKGSFVKFVTEGSVGAPCPPEGCPFGTAFGVQLIK